MSDVIEKYIQFEIPDYQDRQNLILAFANSGYKVWVTTFSNLGLTQYFVNVRENK